MQHYFFLGTLPMPADFFATVVLLLILLDPIGNVPFLIAQLKPLPVERRQRVIVRESLIAGVILLAFVFCGDWMLATLRLSESALEISGGLILFLIAMGMVFPRATMEPSDPDLDNEPFIVPIAIPMIAGPASLAMVLLTARQSTQLYSLVAAIVLAVFVNTLVLLASGHLARLFGKAGLTAMERLMGLVLTAISVQMLISGLKAAFVITAA